MEREKVLKILGENPEGMKAQEIADKAGLTKAVVDKEYMEKIIYKKTSYRTL